MSPVALAKPPSTLPAPADPGLVGPLLAALPPLTNVQRHAFRGQFTAADCDHVCARVDASAVHDDALAWLPLIDRTLARTPLLVRRYGRARFAWMLECVRDLGDALELRGPDDEPGHASRDHLARARRAAERMHEELVEALSVLATGDDDETSRLEEAARGGDGAEALGLSLRALARLAEDWIDREGPGVRALVASVDLSAADVEAARAAAHAAVCSGCGNGHGEPALVGRAEGRVILEMGLAMRLFERAHRRDARVPLLVPGPGARAALVGSAAVSG